MSSETKVPKMLRVRELEAATGIERWRWYELFRTGGGPAHIRIGKVIRVSEGALATWIAEQEQQTKEDA
jgi:predicted DNA-binding transcriptional regulator AlpA